MLMLAGFAFAQESEHLKVAPLPQKWVSAEDLSLIQSVEPKLLELAKVGNKSSEYTSVFNQIVPMLTSQHQPISDDELLELRKSMSIQICDYGIFDYFFCNSRFEQGSSTVSFRKTQGSQLVDGLIYRVDASTLYLLESSEYTRRSTTTNKSGGGGVFDASVLYKLSNDLYVILHPSKNGRCGEIHVLR